MKNRNFLVFIICCILAFALFIVYVFEKTNKTVLSCSNATANLGRILVCEGVSVGKWTYKIRNHSNKNIAISKIIPSCSCISVSPLSFIPANETVDLKAELTIPVGDIYERAFAINIQPEDKAIPPLTVTISGRGGFCSYPSRKIIDFGICSVGKTRETEIDIILTSQKTYSTIVKTIQFSNPQLFSFKILPIEKEERLTEEHETFYFYKNKIVICARQSNQGKEEFLREKLKIEMVNGDAHVIPIFVDFREPIFLQTK